jgi:hypothetical protein
MKRRRFLSRILAGFVIAAGLFGFQTLGASPVSAAALQCDPVADAPYCSNPTTTISILGHPCSDSSVVKKAVTTAGGTVSLVYSTECRAVYALSTTSYENIAVETASNKNDRVGTLVDVASFLYSSGTWRWTPMLNDANLFGWACGNINDPNNFQCTTNPGF